MNKKIYYLVLLVAMFTTISRMLPPSAREKMEQDYKKIETLNTAMQTVAEENYRRSTDPNHQVIYWYPVSIVRYGNDTLATLLKEALGGDFDSVLSTGDELYIKAYSYKAEYEIYAGDSYDAANMLYPTWNYTKLEQPHR